MSTIIFNGRMRLKLMLGERLLATLCALVSVIGTVRAADPNIFVTEDFGNEVARINSRGVVRSFATVQSPQGLAFDAVGALYVASFEDSAVYKI
ncbi:MAG TPA: hypothetical protein VH207_04655, partial [Chthoniobacterales bacterium]|nr:hypothetical protein [Chthoniobacterales bacterium]